MRKRAWAEARHTGPSAPHARPPVAPQLPGQWLLRPPADTGFSCGWLASLRLEARDTGLRAGPSSLCLGIRLLLFHSFLFFPCLLLRVCLSFLTVCPAGCRLQLRRQKQQPYISPSTSSPDCERLNFCKKTVHSLSLRVVLFL